MHAFNAGWTHCAAIALIARFILTLKDLVPPRRSTSVREALLVGMFLWTIMRQIPCIAIMVMTWLSSWHLVKGVTQAQNGHR